MIGLPRGWGRQKPALGARINWSHPLTVGLVDCVLFNEGGGQTARNLVRSAYDATGTSTPTWTATAAGIAAATTGGSSFDIPDHGNYAAGAFTIRIVHRPVSWPGGFTILCDKGSGSRELSVFIDTSGNCSYLAIGGGENTSSVALGMTPGTVWDYVLRRTLPDIADQYVNARLIGTNARDAVTGAAVPLALGRNQSGGGSHYDGAYIACQVWTRALSSAEIAQLHVEPYAFISPPGPARAYFFPAPGEAAGAFPRRTLSAFGARAGSRAVVGV